MFCSRCPRPSRNRQLQLDARAACRAAPFMYLPMNLLHTVQKAQVEIPVDIFQEQNTQKLSTQSTRKPPPSRGT